MTFLAPLFLFGLLAAAVPVAIHLIRREKPPKLVFSTLRFLKKTSKKLVLFQKIQQWLLLLMRAAIICLLVFAFARPLVNQSLSALVDAEPESFVILLDGSMSMHFGDHFETAKDAARDLVTGMSPGDEIALISFADSAQRVQELTTDPDAAHAFIDALEEPGYRATRFLPILQLANQMLENSRHESRRIVMISDFQEIGLGNGSDGWALAPGVSFEGIDVSPEQMGNLALSDVRSPDQLVEEVTEHNILARVRNSGTVHLDTAEVMLLIDGIEVARETADLRDRSEAVVNLPAVFETEGTHRGEVRLSAANDGFELDDVFYFSVDVLPRIKVLAVNGDASQNWYDDESHWFNLAVTSAETSPFELETVTPEMIEADLLAEHDVAVLLNVSDLSDAQARAIESYVRDGGNLLIAPGNRVNAQRFNQQFAAISPALLVDQSNLPEDGYLVIADRNQRHPVLQPLGSDWAARFEGYWPMELAEGAEVLMRFDNASPALVESAAGQAGDGRVMLFGSSMDLEWNNLPLQGIFLPFVHETLRHLVQVPDKQRAYRVGQPVDLAATTQGQALPADIMLRDTDGTEVELPEQSTVLVPERPGFVTLEGEGEGGREFFAVNADPVESNLRKVAVSVVNDAVINSDTTPRQSAEVRTAQLMAELERPQRIWWWLLILVVLLVLAEGYIANRTYR